jgi:hypothetical protein
VKKQTNKPTPEPEILEPEPPRKPTGRPSSYTFEVSEEICHQMAGGKGLRAICAQEGMPHRGTVLKWLNDRPDFASRYAQAREALMDWYAEEILKIAFDDSGDLIIDGDRVMSGHHVVARARLKIDTVRWIMAKLHPGKYGDKPTMLEANSGPITISWASDRSAGSSGRLYSICFGGSGGAIGGALSLSSPLLVHYAEEKPTKPVVLKPRGRSGKFR